MRALSLNSLICSLAQFRAGPTTPLDLGQFGFKLPGEALRMTFVRRAATAAPGGSEDYDREVGLRPATPVRRITVLDRLLGEGSELSLTRD